VSCGSQPIRYNPINSYRTCDAISSEKQLYAVAASRLDLWNFNERNYAQRMQKVSSNSQQERMKKSHDDGMKPPSM